MRYDVFISYHRETGAETARMVQQNLKQRGYRCFLDVDSVRGGDFQQRILTALYGAPNFIFILTDGSAERLNDEDSHIHIELIEAVRKKKRIVIVAQKGCRSILSRVRLPSALSKLQREQVSVVDTGELFEKSIDLIERRLVSSKRRLMKCLLIGALLCVLGSIVYVYHGWEVKDDSASRIETERVALKMAYEAEISEFLKAHQGCTTYDMVMDARAAMEIKQRWARKLVQWKIGTLKDSEERSYWVRRIDEDLDKLNRQIEEAKKEDHGSSSRYIVGWAYEHMYDQQIVDLLMSADDWARQIRKWNAVKNASGKMAGQRIQFSNGVADWRDEADKSEEWPQGFPMKVYIMKNYMWEVQGYVYALLGLDNAFTWNSIGITSVSSFRLLFARFKEGALVEVSPEKFELTDDLVFRLDEGSGRIFVNSKRTGKIERELWLGLWDHHDSSNNTIHCFGTTERLLRDR